MVEVCRGARVKRSSVLLDLLGSLGGSRRCCALLWFGGALFRDFQKGVEELVFEKCPGVFRFFSGDVMDLF